MHSIIKIGGDTTKIQFLAIGIIIILFSQILDFKNYMLQVADASEGCISGDIV